MKLNTTYLHSRLARRIFWLFVVCALLPIGVLTVVSFAGVSSELKQQSRRRLHQAGHDVGMSIYERVQLLDANLKLIQQDIRNASPLDGKVKPLEHSANAEGRFRGVSIIHPDGKTNRLHGGAVPRVDLNERESAFVESGKTLLTVRPCATSARCIYLVQEFDRNGAGHDRLLAEVDPAFLWQAETLPELVDICVLDGSDQLLYCSRKAPTTSFPTTASSTGAFEWKADDQDYLAQYWKLPLRSTFLEEHWTVVASEAEADALSSMGNFRRSFPLVISLAVWVVLLLSIVQIRRTLIPLEKLREGTKRVASGEFESRVNVESKDEFQELATSFNFMAAHIEKQVHSLKTLNEIDQAILSSWNLEQIVDGVIARLPELLPYEMAAITILSTEFNKLSSTYYGSSDRRDGLQVENAELTAEEMSFLAAHPEVYELGSKQARPQFLWPLLRQGMSQFLMVPIFLENKPAAVLTLGRAETRTWSNEDRQQARRVADQVGVALSNAALVSQLQQSHWGTLTALAKAIDAKSPWTSGHSERVTNMAIKIAQEMGIQGREIDILHAGGLLHDIGKIGVPGELLDKPGRLTEQEKRQIQEHVMIGVRILQPIPGFAKILPIVREHHEWFNGKGYPHGIAGDKISRHGRIFAVADVYDAVATDRPYRKGMPMAAVLELIRNGSGVQFDPNVVQAFLRIMGREKTAAGTEVYSEPAVVAVG